MGIPPEAISDCLKSILRHVLLTRKAFSGDSLIQLYLKWVISLNGISIKNMAHTKHTVWVRKERRQATVPVTRTQCSCMNQLMSGEFRTHISPIQGLTPQYDLEVLVSGLPATLRLPGQWPTCSVVASISSFPDRTYLEFGKMPHQEAMKNFMNVAFKLCALQRLRIRWEEGAVSRESAADLEWIAVLRVVQSRARSGQVLGPSVHRCFEI